MHDISVMTTIQSNIIFHCFDLPTDNGEISKFPSDVVLQNGNLLLIGAEIRIAFTSCLCLMMLFILSSSSLISKA